MADMSTPRGIVPRNEDWDAARRAVRDEVNSRGVESDEEIAGLLGVHESTWRNFWTGRTDRPQRRTTNKLEDALGWRRGTLERIARGETPPSTQPEHFEPSDPSATLSDQGDPERALRWAHAVAAMPHLDRDILRALFETAEARLAHVEGRSPVTMTPDPGHGDVRNAPPGA